MKNKIFKIFLLVLILLILGFIGFICFGMKGISKGHVKENVPKGNAFDEYLSRDLDLYFDTSKALDVEIGYELLRKNPSQSGLAYPKYYLWVDIKSLNNTLIEQGVVRVAAINQESFQITDYLSEDEIRNNPESLKQLFPDDIILKIKNKLGIN